MKIAQRLPGLLPVILGASGVFLLLFSLVFRFFILQLIVDGFIKKTLVLENGSLFYEKWQETHLAHLKFHFYNVTNPMEILEGASPIITEVGPYCYRYLITNTDVHSVDEDTVAFRPKYESYFDADCSESLHDSDIITVLDPAFLGMLVLVDGNSQGQADRITPLVKSIFRNRTSPFVSVSVREFLFLGIPLNCSARQMMAYLACRQMVNLFPKYFWTLPNREFRYALARERNMTDANMFTVHRGRNDIRQYATIKTRNNSTLLPYWGSQYCNMINGSHDGITFSPRPSTEDPAYYYEPELQRTLFVEYARDTEFQGLKLMRFETTSKLFASSPDNECYCPISLIEDDNGTRQVMCPPNGFLDMTRTLGVPQIVSLARFLYSEQNMSNVVKEYKPLDYADIISFAEIEPHLGITVKGAKRLQLNMQLKRAASFEFMKKVHESIFPIVWVELIYELNSGLIDLLRNELRRLDTIDLSLLILVGMSVIIIIVAAGIFIYNKSIAHSKVEEINCVSNKAMAGGATENRYDKPVTKLCDMSDAAVGKVENVNDQQDQSHFSPYAVSYQQNFM